MNRNIEIKAKARDFLRQKRLAEEISDAKLEILHQSDTFFRVESGRLKLRVFDENHGELIFYHRADTKGAKTSEYQISPTNNPQILLQTLASALGIIGTVKKTRYVYRFGQTRIHFDEVENLGCFIEFEYVLQAEETTENGQRVVRELMKKLEIEDSDLMATAYLDLLTG
jgi:predicted adenylyl cyclase CyaB